MRIKRVPLLGAIGIILIIILLATTIGMYIHFEKKYAKLTSINESLSTTVSEQNITIKGLETEKNDLTSKISELEKENKELKEKTQKKTTTSKPQSTSVSASVSGTSLGKFKITAYCNCSKCCGKWAGGPTASGVMPKAGRTIAVDPKVIPLGTKVIIDGKVYVAEDTGGAIKGNRIDMYFATHSEALNWGVRYRNVSIVK